MAGGLAHGAADSAAFNLRSQGHRPTPDWGTPGSGRCELLDLHLESHTVGAGVDGHKVIPNAKWRLVSRSAQGAGANRISRGAGPLPAAACPPWGLLASLLCVSGVSFLYWLVYRCLIRCELLPRRL